MIKKQYKSSKCTLSGLFSILFGFLGGMLLTTLFHTFANSNSSSRKVIYDKLTKFDYFSSPGTIRHCDAWFIPSWLDEVGLEIICKNDLKFAALLFIHGFQDLIVQIFQNIDSPNNKFILEKMLVENYWGYW